MAKWIKADGTEVAVVSVGRKWTLKELQDKVGGYIQIMPGVGRLRMVMNEEAALRPLPINQKATDLVRVALKGKTLMYVPVIRGDVLVLEKGESM